MVDNSSLSRFLLVGAAGFIVDILLFSCVHLLFSTTPITARVISFIFAATATWWGNRCFTFKDKQSNYSRQWTKYLISASLSAIPNLAMFTFVLDSLAQTGMILINYIALVCGVLTGMISNYLLSRLWVFNLTSN